MEHGLAWRMLHVHLRMYDFLSLDAVVHTCQLFTVDLIDGAVEFCYVFTDFLSDGYIRF